MRANEQMSGENKRKKRANRRAAADNVTLFVASGAPLCYNIYYPKKEKR